MNVQTAHIASTEPCYLLNLPAELRLHIYRHVFQGEETLHIAASNSKPGSDACSLTWEKTQIFSLLRTCRLIHHECTEELVYRKIKLNVTFQSMWYGPAAILDRIANHSATRYRDVHVDMGHVDCFRWHQNVEKQLISVQKRAASLRLSLHRPIHHVEGKEVLGVWSLDVSKPGNIIKAFDGLDSDDLLTDDVMKSHTRIGSVGDNMTYGDLGWAKKLIIRRSYEFLTKFLRLNMLETFWPESAEAVAEREIWPLRVRRV